MKELRVVVTNGIESRCVGWVNVGARDIYWGVKGVPSHVAYHGSGEIHLKRQKPPKEEPPAAAIGCYHGKDKPFKIGPLSDLRGSELLGFCLIPITDDCLQDYEPLGKKKYDGIVYVDSRLFGKFITVKAWASRPNYFFERMPDLPGFRSVFNMTMGDSKLVWVVIDVEGS